jgi:two-component system, OmpR family, sensor histidine kinase KdpD
MARSPLDAAAVVAQLVAMAETIPKLAHARLATRLQAYAGAIAMVAVSTLLGLWIAPRWGTAPVDMIYLPAVLAAAALWGLGPALAGGITATLAYNFFFTQPVHTLRMDRATDIVTVLVLLMVALVTSKLASDIRAQARLAEAHASRNATIAGFARRLLSCGNEEDIARTACAQLHRLFGCNAMLVGGLPEPRILAAEPEGNRLTPSDLAAAALTIESGEPAGRATRRSQPAEWQFHPVRSGGAVLAAAGLARDDGAPPVEPEQLPLLENLLDQVALALETARLEREAREFAATRDRDQFRASLLSSIGDDLRPRLTAIGSAVRALRRDAASNKEIVSTIASEVLQVDRYVENLVDLGPEGGQQPIEVGSIRIDLFNRAVSRDGEPVHLTPKEYAVLAELAKHRGRVLTHAHLLRAVWGPAQEHQIDYLRVAIRALRQKLEAQPSQPRLIVNEPSVGYRLVAG